MRTWATIKPKVEAEITSIKEALATAPLDRVLELQAYHAALVTIVGWFDEGAPADKAIFTDTVTY